MCADVPHVVLPDGADTPTANEKWQLKTMEDAILRRATRPPWVVQDLVLRDCATLVSAQPKSMKSLSWLEAVIEAVAHQKVWGHFAAPDVRRALFIETEDPQWLVEARIAGFNKGLDLTSSLPGFNYACPGPFDLVKEAPSLEALFRRAAPDFVVLSTLQNMLGGRDWNTQEQMAEPLAKIVELARIAPLVVITHSPHDQKLRRAAGTITQAANFAIELHYKKNQAAADVRVASKVGSGLDRFNLKLEVDSTDTDEPARVRRIAVDAAAAPKGAKTSQIAEALRATPSATSQAIAEIVGCSDRHVRKVRKAAEAIGRDAEEPSGTENGSSGSI